MTNLRKMLNCYGEHLDRFARSNEICKKKIRKPEEEFFHSIINECKEIIENFNKAIEYFSEENREHHDYRNKDMDLSYMYNNKGYAHGILEGLYKDAELYDEDSEKCHKDAELYNEDSEKCHKDAIYCFDKAIEIKSIPDAHRNKAFLLNKEYLRNKDVNRNNLENKAEEYFQDAICSDPINPYAYNSYGYFMLNHCISKINSTSSIEKMEENHSGLKYAISLFARAIDIQKNFSFAYYNKGYAHYIRGKVYEKAKNETKANKQFFSALENFNKALEIDPDFEYAWNTKGVVFSALKRYHDAIDCFDKSSTIQKSKIFDIEYKQINSDAASFAKGYALYSLRRNLEAEECFEKAINKYENDFYAWFYKGNNLFDLKKYRGY